MEYWHYLFAATACLVSIIVKIYYLDEKKRILRRLPGPTAYPLVGNALQLKSDPAEFYKQLLGFFAESQKSHGIGVLWLFHYPIVALSSASAVEVVLCSSKHAEKSPDYDFLHDWLGLGLLTSAGVKWKERRRLLTPTFHFDVLKEFLPIFNQHSATLVEKLRSAASSSDTVDVFPLLTRGTLDIICETAMGRNLDAQSDGSGHYVDAVYRASELLTYRQRRPWLWNTTIYNLLPKGRLLRSTLKTLHDFTDAVIRERRAQLCAELDHTRPKKRLAFLDLLLCMEPALTNEDIREEVDTFMFEGHDTTAAALGWTIHLLGAHPDVQQKCREELAAIFEDSSREIDHDDLKKMTYLECVIKEALRIFPSVPMFMRRLSEDTNIGGYVVPQGTTVAVLSGLLHHDPQVFPDPDKFDPDRFASEMSLKRHPFAYVPFSAGLRNCIGQKFAMTELKVVLASVLRNFSVEAVQRTEDLKPVPDLILRPSAGIHVRLSPFTCG